MPAIPSGAESPLKMTTSICDLRRTSVVQGLWWLVGLLRAMDPTCPGWHQLSSHLTDLL